MRILIKDAANNQTVLCDGPGRGINLMCGPDGLASGDQPQIQQAPRFRAASMLFFNRGNLANKFAFSVIREMPDMRAAILWHVTFQRDCIRAGTVQFIETDQNGVQQTAQLQNAMLSLQIQPLGVSRKIAFTLEGGVLTAP